MSKAKSKSKLSKKPPEPKASRGRHVKGRRLVEFKPRQPRTAQKTVRVRTVVLAALEEEANSVKPNAISVPAVITQILDKWFDDREAAKEAKAAAG